MGFLSTVLTVFVCFCNRAAEKRIRQKMMEKDGAETFYYQPATARYQRFAADNIKRTEEFTGVN